MIPLHIRFAFVSIAGALWMLHIASGANTPPPKPHVIFAVFRNGERAPTASYPKDPYINFKWHGGLGALSLKGMQQAYNLGKKLRARYLDLIPTNGLYTKERISVVSSDTERCIMSADSLLAGFMPPLRKNHNLIIDWQPVPVSPLSRNTDKLLAQNKQCKKYDEAMTTLRQNLPSDLKELNAKNRDLYDILRKETGKPIRNELDIKNMYDTLLAEKSAGLLLPEWTDAIFPERMIPFAERYFTLQTETPFMKKVKAGPFITEMFQKMIKRRQDGLQPNRTIFLYSAHEHTLANIAHFLNINEAIGNIHDYAAALIFELHTHSFIKKELQIQFFYYQNSSVRTPKEVYIPKCGPPCGLNRFEELFNDTMVNNFEQICENPQ